MIQSDDYKAVDVCPSEELIHASLKNEGPDQADLRPFSKPELALTQSFRLISSDDW